MSKYNLNKAGRGSGGVHQQYDMSRPNSVHGALSYSKANLGIDPREGSVG